MRKENGGSLISAKRKINGEIQHGKLNNIIELLLNEKKKNTTSKRIKFKGEGKRRKEKQRVRTNEI